MGEAARLAKISNMAQAVLGDPNSSERDKDQARRIMSNAQYRMGEVSRGAAPGYRANKSPGMGYGFGPDLPQRNYGLLI